MHLELRREPRYGLLNLFVLHRYVVEVLLLQRPVLWRKNDR